MLFSTPTKNFFIASAITVIRQNRLLLLFSLCHPAPFRWLVLLEFSFCPTKTMPRTAFANSFRFPLFCCSLSLEKHHPDRYWTGSGGACSSCSKPFGQPRERIHFWPFVRTSRNDSNITVESRWFDTIPSKLELSIWKTVTSYITLTIFTNGDLLYTCQWMSVAWLSLNSSRLLFGVRYKMR